MNCVFNFIPEKRSFRRLDIFEGVIAFIELINDEPFPSYSKPNLWVGYNAFNWMLHNTLKKTFSQQEKLDKVLFDEIYAMV